MYLVRVKRKALLVVRRVSSSCHNQGTRRSCVSGFSQSSSTVCKKDAKYKLRRLLEDRVARDRSLSSLTPDDDFKYLIENLSLERGQGTKCTLVCQACQEFFRDLSSPLGATQLGSITGLTNTLDMVEKREYTPSVALLKGNGLVIRVF